MGEAAAEPRNPRKKISIVTPCFNEEGNVAILSEAVARAMQCAPQVDYEHIFIDNASTDSTQEILRGIASRDKRVKCIFNLRNFGHLKSPFYGLLQTRSDAAVLLVADLQEPPELIPEFVRKWESGHKLVVGIKSASAESRFVFALRKSYYRVLSKISSNPPLVDFSGFALYDAEVVELLRNLEDPNPYLRGMVSGLGYEPARIQFTQELRKSGITKNGFYSLYDLAMLGVTTHSRGLARAFALALFSGSGICFVIALAIGLFMRPMPWAWACASLALSFQFLVLAFICEYVVTFHRRLEKKPLIIEKERVNF